MTTRARSKSAMKISTNAQLGVTVRLRLRSAPGLHHSTESTLAGAILRPIATLHHTRIEVNVVVWLREVAS